MIVGTLKVIVHFHVAQSLKDKRSEVKRILARIKPLYPVAMAEVGELDKWQTSELGFVCVSNDQAVCERILDGVEAELESKGDAEVMRSERDYIHM